MLGSCPSGGAHPPDPKPNAQGLPVTCFPRRMRLFSSFSLMPRDTYIEQGEDAQTLASLFFLAPVFPALIFFLPESRNPGASRPESPCTLQNFGLIQGAERARCPRHGAIKDRESSPYRTPPCYPHFTPALDGTHDDQQ